MNISENYSRLPFISSAACLNWTLPRLRRTSAAIVVKPGHTRFDVSLRGTDTLDTFFSEFCRSFTGTSAPWYGANLAAASCANHTGHLAVRVNGHLLTRLDVISTYTGSALKHRPRSVCDILLLVLRNGITDLRRDKNSFRLLGILWHVMVRKNNSVGFTSIPFVLFFSCMYNSLLS